MATNLLFFTKGEPTKEIWYWEHKLPEGKKAYSKTKPIQNIIEEEQVYSSKELLDMLHESFQKSDTLLEALKKELV